MTLSIIQLPGADTISSLPNGDPQDHWTPTATWRQLAGTRFWRLQGDVLALRGGTNPRVSIFAQTSVDGENWTDYEDQSGSRINIATVDAVGEVSGEFAPVDPPPGPFIRFGVQVEDTSTDSQVSVQATFVVTAFRMPVYTSAVSSGTTSYTVTAGASMVSLTPAAAFPCGGYKRAVVTVRGSGGTGWSAGSAGTAFGYRLSADGSNWSRVYDPGAGSVEGVENQPMVFGVEPLANYIEIVGRSTGLTGTVNAHFEVVFDS
jgi:hypothetical protein